MSGSIGLPMLVVIFVVALALFGPPGLGPRGPRTPR
jgi:Sec-independent protein translocase protein TatA